MTFTTAPAAGAKLRASVLSAMVTEVRPIAVRKASDQTQSATVVLLNDTELFASVEATLTYTFELVIIYEAGTAADYRWALTFPTGSAASWGVQSLDSALAYVPVGSSSYTSGNATGLGGAAIGTQRSMLITGVIVVGASAGTFRYQWAQLVSTVENTKTAAGSTLVLRRLA